MNIIFPTAINPSNNPNGGIEVYIKNLISGIKRIEKKIDFSIIGFGNFNKDSSYYNLSHFHTIYNQELSGNKYFFKLLFNLFKITIPKNSIIHAQQADIILPFGIFKSKTKRICTIHGAQRRNIYLKKGLLWGIIYDILEFISLIFVHYVITVDKETEEFYRNRFPFLRNKIETISNGIDTTLFKPLKENDISNYKKRQNLKLNDKIILFVGRLEKEKNIPFLIEVFLEVSKYIDNANLIIAGTGKEELFLKNLVKTKKIQKIKFLGHVNQSELPLLYNISDVTIICSKFEASPIAARETLACNTPLIATNVGDIQYKFSNWQNVSILNEDLNEFIQEIKTVLKSDKKNIFKEEEIEQISINNTIKQTLNIYNNILC